MSNDPEKHDDEQSSTGDEISEDALGDTHLGKNLGHLIREIGLQQKRIQEKNAAAKVTGSEFQDSDTADRMERLNEALDVVAANKENSGSALAFVDHTEEAQASTSSNIKETNVGGGANRAISGDAVSSALTEIEKTLRRFAEAERKRHEEELENWKARFKKAAMIAIKKQVEAARTNWAKRSSENEAKVAEHYRKLKILADKVARQKVEIQKAKQELKDKLEIADRLHVEFDSIRQVLDGKLGVLDELDKDEEQS